MGQGLRGIVVGTAIASWFSVVTASAIAAIQLAISGTVPLFIGMTAMVGWHVMIGVGEALVTVATVTFIWRSRPDLLYTSSKKMNSELLR